MPITAPAPREAGAGQGVTGPGESKHLGHLALPGHLKDVAAEP